MITNEQEMLAYLSAEDREQAKRNVYKATECGAWISFETEDGGIKIGSIVEGCDSECTPHTLLYPFSEAEYEACMAVIEQEADDLRNDVNEEAAYYDELNRGYAQDRI